MKGLWTVLVPLDQNNHYIAEQSMRSAVDFSMTVSSISLREPASDFVA
jgi:hypothetical protein